LGRKVLQVTHILGLRVYPVSHEHILLFKCICTDESQVVHTEAEEHMVQPLMSKLHYGHIPD
jgi:hypothetical protein